MPLTQHEITRGQGSASGNRTIIAAVDDMFFASKIRATAETLGTKVVFARTNEAVLHSACENRPALIIVDLQSQKIDALGLAGSLRSESKLSGIPLLGFYSHVLVELQRAAIDAGFDRVIPRSVFARELPQILSGN